MAHFKRKLVLFDIDGTLLLTAGAGRRAIVTALTAEIGDHLAFEQVRFDGKTDPQIIGEILAIVGHPEWENPVLVTDLCHRYVACLEEELRAGAGRIRTMPGVVQLLDRLEEDPAVVLGLLTGNMERGAALKLQAARLDPGRFLVGAFGSDAAHRPQLPAIAARRAQAHFGRSPAGDEVVIIGDTPADVTCGRELCARAIGVATGSYTLQELQTAGAYAAFVDLSDTEAVLNAVHR